MTTKKTAKPKKVAPARKPAAKKAAAKKAPALACGVCGFTVTIDEACGCAEAHPVICCGVPMKQR